MLPSRNRSRRCALALLLACLGGCSGSGQRLDPQQPATLAAGDHTFTLQQGDLTRRYHVHVPPRRDERPLPLLLALHGGGGSGRQFQRENALDPVADREVFLAVYPDGTGPLRERLLTWNAGTHCCGWARAHAVDDSGFLAAVLDDLAARIPFDTGRVYVTGHSNGAMMAYRFAAEYAERVVAIVPVAGAMDLATFNPARPVAVLHIHSTDDPRALYEGGLGPSFPGTDQRVEHQPVTSGLARWAAYNGCEPQPQVLDTRAGSGTNAGQDLTHLVYRGCRPDGAVEHLRLSGSGHGWPGVTAPRWRQRLLGPPTTLVDASAAAWQFAARFVRDR
ncbi:MAG: PHB depolymerase family esterase [Pseudomonadota bacterium]